MDPMTQPSDQLDTRLRSLAGDARWPATPEVVGGAVTRLRAGAATPRRARLGLGWRVVALALLALLIAAAVAGAALFGLPDLRFGSTDALPTPAASPDAQAIRRWLGRPGDLAAARAALGDDLRIPEARGEPDEVYLGDGAWQDRVALLYHAEPGAPSVADGLGLIVTEWRGGFDDRFARKWLQEREGHAEVVDVEGSRGYWVSGMPHVLEYLDDESGIRRASIRLVGDVLVWQVRRHGVSHRVAARSRCDARHRRVHALTAGQSPASRSMAAARPGSVASVNRSQRVGTAMVGTMPVCSQAPASAPNGRNASVATRTRQPSRRSNP